MWPGKLRTFKKRKCPMGWKPKSAEGIPGKRHQRRTWGASLKGSGRIVNTKLLGIWRTTKMSALMRKVEKAMGTHFSTLAWKIPWTKEPGRLQSMESWRVRHDRATSLSLFTFMHWRRKWQPTPSFLPGKSHAWRSPVGCSPWGHKKLDTNKTMPKAKTIPSCGCDWW